MPINIIDCEAEKYVVNIGASVGEPYDPSYQYIIDPAYRGLCIEGDVHKIEGLRKNVSSKMDIHNGYVTPFNVISLFERYKVPKNLFIIKIDIDGYDLEVLRTILKSEYRPTLFVAEINEKIPPPIRFEVLYKSDYKWDCSHCFGFSIQSGKDVFESSDYFIATMYEMNNILCIRKDKIYLLPEESFPKDIEDMYDKQYRHNRGLRKKAFPWNANVNHWLTIEDNDTLKNTITKYFTEINDRSKFKNKLKIENKDFMIY